MGRPLGSKNKPKVGSMIAPTVAVRRRGRPSKDNKIVIGDGVVSYTFPIVQEETTKKPVIMLTVRRDTFLEALVDAVAWAVRYSATKNAHYWPLVRYKAHSNGAIPSEKRYVKRVGGMVGSLAYTESRDIGSWLHTDTLEAL